MKTKPFRFALVFLSGLLAVGTAWGFAFIKDDRKEGALPIKWPPGTVTLQLKLGSSQGGVNFDTAAQASIQNWNNVIGNLRITGQVTTGTTAAQSNGANEAVFAANVFGESFGDSTLAITTVWSRGNERTQADIVFNSARTWGVYDGPTQSGTIDLKRVALHELGHLLGLDHPDEAGQTFSPPTPIMNSRITSNDTLTSDDIAGAQSIYGPPGTPANDNFADAITLTLNGSGTATGTGYNTNATKQAGEPTHVTGTTGGRSVWWRWTAPSAGSMIVDTRGSYFDSILAVYTGTSLTTLTQVGSNDDIQNDSAAHIQASRVTFNATGGTTYYFAVDGWDADSAGVTLNLAFTSTGPAVPVITTQPASATVTTGGSASFSVVATGASSYQWLFNNAAISGATSASYTVSNAQAANAGSYTVTVTNSAGSITSNAATLTVNAPVTPTTPPSSGGSSGGGGGGGGGAPSQWFLGALSLLTLVRLLRRRT